MAASVPGLGLRVGPELRRGGFRVASGLMPGDANGDGRVDINDLTIVLSNFGQTEMTWQSGYFTGDGTVDVNDLTILLSNFGQSFGSSAVGGFSAAPEPALLRSSPRA